MSIAKMIQEMKPARGRDLDRLGELYGVRRWRFWFLAWPLDRWFRKRVLTVARGGR